MCVLFLVCRLIFIRFEFLVRVDLICCLRNFVIVEGDNEIRFIVGFFIFSFFKINWEELFKEIIMRSVIGDFGNRKFLGWDINL